MRVKRLLCSILALAMVLSTMSVSVFAVEDSNETEAVAMFNGEYYSTVEKALADAVASTDEKVTITVLKDVETLPEPQRAGLTFEAAQGVKVTSHVETPRFTPVSGEVKYVGFDFTTYDTGNGLYATRHGQENLEGFEAVFENCTFGGQKSIGIWHWAVKSPMEKLTIDNCTITDGDKAYFQFGAVNHVVIQNCDFSNYTTGDYIVHLPDSAGSITATNCQFGNGFINFAPNIGNSERDIIIDSCTFEGEKAVRVHENVTNNTTPIGTIELTNNTVEETTELINFKDTTVVAEEYIKANVSTVTAIGNETSSGEAVTEISTGYTPVAPVASVNGKYYATLSEAFAGATADVNGVVTYEIYGKATLDNAGWISPRAKSGATTINFVGMTDDAEISITSTKAAIIATDGISDMVAINYEDLILSRPNGSWAGDYGHANNYFTTWMRGSADAVVTYTDCTFTNGSCNNQYAKTVYTDCTFNNPTEYALWIYGGEVTVTGGTFVAEKGVKVYSEDNAAYVKTAISYSGFDIASKPAVVSSIPGEVTLTEVDASECEYGLLATEFKDHGVNLPEKYKNLATVTVDGEAPEYVAMINGEVYTSYAYALSEAKGDTSKVEIPVAKIGNDYYTSIDAAITAAEANDVIDLLGGTISLADAQQMTVQKNITITNGTIDITGVDIAANALWLVKSATLTFDNVTLIGNGYDSAFGVVYLVTKDAGVKFIDSTVNLNADGKSGGFVKGDGYMGTALIDNTDITLVATNRGFISTEVTIQNDSHVSVSGNKNLEGWGIENAFNICGITVKDTSTIDIKDCYEYGIKVGDAAINIEDTAKVTATGSTIADVAHRTSENTGVITVEESAVLEAGNIVLNNTVEGEGSAISKADAVYVQYKKVDVDADGNDTVEGNDKYELVLAGADAEKINELASADLTFKFVGTPVTGGAMSYTVAPAEGVSLSQLGDRFMFNYDGVNKHEETGAAIVIGTITVNGYGSYTLATAESEYNAVYATEIRDNIVDGFEDAATLVINADMVADDGMVGEITDGSIAVPTRELTINLDFPNEVVDNAKAYQDMKVEITGTIDGVNQTVTYKLGTDEVAMANGDYIVEEDRLVLNNAYTVTVSGAGYRTARYTVTMTDDKQLNFWNNVMDEAQFVEFGKDSSVAKVTFLAGDIVKDNNINIYDLSAVVSYFGSVSTTENGYAKYDLNRDGVIDSKDVAYVLVSWNN